MRISVKLPLSMWLIISLLSLTSISCRSLYNHQPNHPSKHIFGRLSAEREVNVSASQAWELYRGLNLFNFVTENIPNLYQKIEVLQGNGGAGTIIYILYPAGTPGLTSDKEEFTIEDNKKRVKELTVIEGGYLDLGFTLFRYRLNIIEKHEEACITKFTIEYKLKKEAAANESYVSIEPMVTIMEAANSYLLKNKHT